MPQERESPQADEALASILDTIGATPLVRLSRIARDVRPTVVAKLEAFNPGGSIKDRVALSMIRAAERDGTIRRGSTIVEPTSGNTGTGLAIAARILGYKVVAVLPDKMSQEKITLLRAYGARVEVAPTSGPGNYREVAAAIVEAEEDAVMLDQYSNAANPAAHFETTGPELWRQSGGRITHFVAGIGTSGTVIGAGSFLKTRSADVEVIAADPVGSIYSSDELSDYLVEGVGEDFIPDVFTVGVVDRYVRVTDGDAFRTARRLAELEGILAGGSGGLALCAALRVASSLGEDAYVAVVLPDSGRSYLSRLFDDEWLTKNLAEDDAA